MNEVINNMLTRRSIRNYKEKQISDNELNAILETAKYAPSGGSSQTWKFTVVQNKEKLDQLTWFCDNKDLRKVLTEISIPENYVVCGAVSLGYISGSIPKASPRKDRTVDII